MLSHECTIENLLAHQQDYLMEKVNISYDAIREPEI